MPRVNIIDKRDHKNVKFYGLYIDDKTEFEGGKLEDENGNPVDGFFLYGILDDESINFNAEYEFLGFCKILSRLLDGNRPFDITLRAWNVNEISIDGTLCLE